MSRALTVAMPAYNAAPYIRQALESVLTQRGVELEVIVVDDGSTDDTRAVAKSIEDPRCRVIERTKRKGIGACHNIILAESRLPVIAHVDADDMVRPGALAKTFDALQSSPEVAMSHCYYLDVDQHGKTTRAEFRARRRAFRKHRPVDLDYRDALRRSASYANALRTYRKSVLLDLGGFNEVLPFGVDYDMALRILEGNELRLVPEFLYIRRVHLTNTTESMVLKRHRMWLRKYLIRRALLRQGQVTYWKDAYFDLGTFLRNEWQRFWS